MLHRRSRLEAGLTALLCMCASVGCKAQPPAEWVVGGHQIRLVAPVGWEHVDHGRQQVFRRAEMELVLEDFGPTVAGKRSLGPDSARVVLLRALASDGNPNRREIASVEQVVLHGAAWTRVKTWDRVTHHDARLYAVIDRAGRLLVLRSASDTRDPSATAFQSLLSSIEIVSTSPSVESDSTGS